MPHSCGRCSVLKKQHSLKNVPGQFEPGELLNDRFSTNEPIRAIDATHYLGVFVTSFLALVCSSERLKSPTSKKQRHSLLAWEYNFI
jgi:hypothetical protein